MGHRANYVFIEGGRSAIYFSRWGALTIPAVLLSGPEATIAYVRALTPDEELQDVVWAEGGLVLNVDRRELRFFGGFKIERAPYLRRPLLRALRAQWPGWTVEWARFGIADLALSLGWDVGRVLDTEFDDRTLLDGSGPLIQEDEIRATRELKQAYGLISVRWSEGDVRDYLLAPQLTEEDRDDLLAPRVTRALSIGPRLLELLADAPTVPLPGEADPDLPGEGAYLDTMAHTLWMSCAFGECDPRELTAVARRWPSWHVHGHVEGLVRQVELSGRDPSAVMVSEDRAIDELVEELTHDYTVDPLGMYTAMTRNEQSPLSDGGGVTFGKGFFSADRPPLSAEGRREMLLRVLRNVSTDADSAAQAE